MSDLNKAVELDDSDAMVYLYRGHLHNANGNFDKAVDDLDRAIVLGSSMEASLTTADPFNLDLAAIYIERAVANRGVQQLTKAVADAKKSVELNPNYARSYVTLGEMLIVNGDVQEALKTLSKAIQLDPNIAEAYYNRAVAYEVTAMMSQNYSYYELAAADLKKVIQVTTDPDIIEAANEGLRKMESKGYIP